MISKIRYRKTKTKLCSVRIDDDLLNYVRSKNLNLSSTVNHLLRAYLYIQSVDDSIVFHRLNGYVPDDDITIDVYSSCSDFV